MTQEEKTNNGLNDACIEINESAGSIFNKNSSLNNFTLNSRLSNKSVPNRKIRKTFSNLLKCEVSFISDNTLSISNNSFPFIAQSNNVTSDKTFNITNFNLNDTSELVDNNEPENIITTNIEPINPENVNIINTSSENKNITIAPKQYMNKNAYQLPKIKKYKKMESKEAWLFKKQMNLLKQEQEIKEKKKELKESEEKYKEKSKKLKESEEKYKEKSKKLNRLIEKLELLENIPASIMKDIQEIKLLEPMKKNQPTKDTNTEQKKGDSSSTDEKKEK